MGDGFAEEGVVVCGGFGGGITDVVGTLRWAGDCQCGGGGGLDDFGVGGERKKSGWVWREDTMGYEQAGWNAAEAFGCDEDTWDGVETEGVDGGGNRFGLRLVLKERA